MASTHATFAFADIAGFTALAEAHGDEAAFELVAGFSRAVRAELPRVDGLHVKTIGDALMLRIPEPGDAILLGSTSRVMFTISALRSTSRHASPPS